MIRTSVFRGLAAVFASVAAGDAGAVMLDPRGLGQVLVFPYYTVNAGQDTLLTVVNTSGAGKAVKVAFREAYNGREALAFTLFLAAHDAWTGAVSAVDGELRAGARLASSDHSCVSIERPAAFSTASFAGSASDGGPATVDRTREGMLEVIALGDVVAGSATDRAITPVQNGASDGGTPRCDLPGDVAADLVAPSSGLFGSGAIANVGEGTFYAYAADALSGFTDEPLLTPSSRASDTDLSDAHSRASAFANGAIATVFDASGDTLRIDYQRGIDAVSAVFMADALYNEFIVADTLGANTDWVVTFPTKQLYVDKRRYPSAITSPFAEPFMANAGGQSRLEFSTLNLFDREGGETWADAFAGGCHAPPGQICAGPYGYFGFQVNVLAFLPATPASSAVFGSARAVGPAFDPFDFGTPPLPDSGWLNLDFGAVDGGAHHLTGGTSADGARITLVGLPVTGFMAYNIINAHAAPGRLANYSGTFRHRTHWSCIGDTAACE